MRYLNSLAAVGLLLLLGGCERWELDRQMEELCKKDGGIKIYETVTLPASAFGSDGEPLFKYRKQSTSRADIFGPEYKFTVNREILAGKDVNPQNGRGQLVRLHWILHRRSDRKLLGEQIEYRRYGGDLLTFGYQPSSSSCPRVDRDMPQLVFIKGSL